MAAVSKHQGSRKNPITRLWRFPIPWFPESPGIYAVDASVNSSTKANKGLTQFHKIVQEDLKDRASLKVCNEEKQKPDIMSRSEKETTNVEKMLEEMNSEKLKNEMSSETLKPSTSKRFSPEQVEKKNLLMPNRKRVMIRSRL